jgi:ATP-dependent helicase/nuclease subunit B
LQKRVTDFDDENTPYLSRPIPMFSSRFGDYDHLARVKEWMAGDEGEEEL